MNIKLLKEVQKHILEEPRRFNMDLWMDHSTTAPCGTQACIAGWAVFLEKKLKSANEEPPHVKTVACKLLGITDDQGSKLFYEDEWPKKYRKPFAIAYREDNQRVMAKVAAQRIEHFIATNGEE